ncbi:hypothetical protein N7468_004507 [Penicillium chermesinum]|uniref:Uncharacterized protein n=1 Tax=Penicillium chermesinum TaxID=63820 RepID=A0A9W9TT96_9EURO|nr:uncharacterized protein N7468_004507 [Penicillium chermesinum]KAJ5239888.1 hypothetical protein N7468_004507 [Penicillium chermesinum]
MDFGRCCEFVDTGDYSIPFPTRESHLIEEDRPAWTPLKRWNPTQLSENIFHSTSIDGYIARLGEQVGRSTWDEDDEPTDPTEDYTEILLAHARVHRVAHQTEWTSLRVLSLYRLTRLLANFTISEDRRSYRRYYIQKLLCDYAAWNVEILMHDAGFEELLDAAPSLEKVIFRLM